MDYLEKQKAIAEKRKELAKIQSDLVKLGDVDVNEYETDQDGNIVCDWDGEPFLKPKFPEDASDVIPLLKRWNGETHF